MSRAQQDVASGVTGALAVAAAWKAVHIWSAAVERSPSRAAALLGLHLKMDLDF